MPLGSAMRAAIKKEWRQESRSLTGVLITALFAFVAAVVMSVALYGQRPNASLFAGLLWTILLFAGTTTLARSFLTEDETGTMTLLRVLSRPTETYLAKTLLATVQMLVVAFIDGAVLVLTTGVHLENAFGFWLSLALGGISVASTATLCGAIASGATNRALVATAIAVPLLIFLASIGTTALLPTLGDPRGSTLVSCLGLGGYAVGTLLIGPPLLAAIWKR